MLIWYLSDVSCTIKQYSAEATATASEERLSDNQLKQTETLKGQSEKKEFQAETRMLLDIVARSLYSDKEVSNIIK